MSTQSHEGQYAVNTSIVINATRRDIWSVLKDFDNVFKWAPGVTKSHAVGKTPLGVGHVRHCDIDGFGSIDETITYWEEDTGFEYTVTPLGPLHQSSSRWTLKDAGQRTARLDITLTYSVRFGVFGKLLHALVMRKKLEASLQSTVSAVKKRVEARDSQPAGVVMNAG